MLFLHWDRGWGGARRPLGKGLEGSALLHVLGDSVPVGLQGPLFAALVFASLSPGLPWKDGSHLQKHGGLLFLSPVLLSVCFLPFLKIVFPCHSSTPRGGRQPLCHVCSPGLAGRQMGRVRVQGTFPPLLLGISIPLGAFARHRMLLCRVGDAWTPITHRTTPLQRWGHSSQ